MASSNAKSTPKNDEKDPAETSSGANVGADETGSAKAANDQAASTDAVVESDPTAVNPRVAAAGISTPGVGEDSVVIKADGSIDGDLYDEAAPQEFVTLNKDVVQEFYYPNTSRPAYKILFTKGQTVPKSAIEEYERTAAARRSSDEAGLADHIDSTTYASGTAVGEAVHKDSDDA